MQYSAPFWLPGGNLQTLWPALFSRAHQGPDVHYQRQRWTTPDHDFIDVDWLPHPSGDKASRPLLVLFHGLEGSSRSHYALAFAEFARQTQMAYAVAHFRGCSGEMNLAPRAYHSGDYQEIDWILKQFQMRHNGPLLAVGVSLGGNALLRWAQEAGEQAQRTVHAVASVCAPVDLVQSGLRIGQGWNRWTYTRMFLNSMKPKALAKLAQHPGLFDKEALLQARDLYAFDNIFTAPLHGFKNTDDYWTRASAKPHLQHMRIPTLVLNSLNDPFIPAHSLPTQTEVSSYVTLWQPSHGGHVGFAKGRFPGYLHPMPQAVGQWLQQQLPKRTFHG